MGARYATVGIAAAGIGEVGMADQVAADVVLEAFLLTGRQGSGGHAVVGVVAPAGRVAVGGVAGNSRDIAPRLRNGLALQGEIPYAHFCSCGYVRCWACRINRESDLDELLATDLPRQDFRYTITND